MTLPKGTRGGQGLSVYQLPTPGVIYFLRYSLLKKGEKKEKKEKKEKEKKEKKTKQNKYNTMPKYASA